MSIRATRVVKFIRKGEPGKDGKDGERGAILRGPQDWENMPEGYEFQAGGEGDEFKDFIIYKGEYYSCTATHSKTVMTPVEGSAASPKLWQLSDRIEMVATQILLAKYALVKNLGVERVQTTGENATIDIHDGIMEVYGQYCCNIRFGVDDDGHAVLNYYDNYGKLLYNLGPDGISKIEHANSYWEELKLLKTHEYSATEEEVRKDYIQDAYPINSGNYGVYYRFHSGYVGSVMEDSINDGKVFTAKVVSSASLIPDGWYRVCDTSPFVGAEIAGGDTGATLSPITDTKKTCAVMQFRLGECRNQILITKTVS